MIDEERQPDRASGQGADGVAKYDQKGLPAQEAPQVLMSPDVPTKAIKRAKKRAKSPKYLRVLRMCRLLVGIGMLFCASLLISQSSVAPTLGSLRPLSRSF